MKRIIKIFKPYMVRPIIYKCVTRCSIALVFILLWDMFINSSLSPVRDACFMAGLVFFMLAWFAYLKLDGLRVHFLGEDMLKKKPKKKIHWTKSIVDFVDEHVVTFEELTEEEQTAALMACNLLGSLIFLLVSLAVSI